MSHFELTDETKKILGVTVHRIRATKDNEHLNVTKGDLGGWVQRASNLEDNAWVAGEAVIAHSATVCEKASVGGNARVYGNAYVDQSALIGNNAIVAGNSIVTDNAVIVGDANILGGAYVGGETIVQDGAAIDDMASLVGKITVQDCAHVGGKVYVKGDNIIIKDNVHVVGSVDVKGKNITIGGDVELRAGRITDEADILKPLDVLYMSGIGDGKISVTLHKTTSGDRVNLHFHDWYVTNFRGTLDSLVNTLTNEKDSEIAQKFTWNHSQDDIDFLIDYMQRRIDMW